MRRYLLGLAVLAALGTPSCEENPESKLRELTRNYWGAVFSGDMASAYAMLSTSSRQNTDIQKFSQAMAPFAPVEAWGTDEFRKAFKARANVTIVAVESKRSQATVLSILLVPTLGSLEESVKAEKPKNAPETWLAEKMTALLKENLTPTSQVRILMTWELEGKEWRFVFSEG